VHGCRAFLVFSPAKFYAICDAQHIRLYKRVLNTANLIGVMCLFAPVCILVRY